MIGIINLELGNIGSILNMCARLGVPARLVRTPAELQDASKYILPGVGDFGHGMQSLRRSGLLPALEKRVLGERIPLLGICLGMQMLSRRSEEGGIAGLGWIAADTVRLRVDERSPSLRVPHMGWNEVEVSSTSVLFKGLASGSRFYFVHTYHVVCDERNDIAATTSYGGPITAAIVNGNLAGTQFHPEKSHRFGMTLLRNFASLC